MENFYQKKISQCPIGTRIQLSYEDTESLTGTITDSDFSRNIELTTDDGDQLLLDLTTVRNCKIFRGAGCVPQTPPAGEDLDWRPDSIPAASDSEIHKLYAALSAQERKFLSGANDSFFYGVKSSDAAKKTRAAEQACEILLAENDKNFFWSDDAVLFTAALLRRVGKYPTEVYLVGNFFREAARCAFLDGKYSLAQAYAVLDLLDFGDQDRSEMLELITHTFYRMDDVSGVIWLYRSKHERSAAEDLLRKALQHKNLASDAALEDLIPALEKAYPVRDSEAELSCWDEPKEEPPQAEVNHEFGWISRLNWASRSGIIQSDSEMTYEFGYDQILDPLLLKTLEACTSSTLNGRILSVAFEGRGSHAEQIRMDDQLISRARCIIARQDNDYWREESFALLRRAVFSPARATAVAELVHMALMIYNCKNDPAYISEALQLFEENPKAFPANCFKWMDLARCYAVMGQTEKMLSSIHTATELPISTPKAKIGLLSNVCPLLRDVYVKTGSKKLIQLILDLVDEFLNENPDLSEDQELNRLYKRQVLPLQIYALSAAGRVEEAKESLAALPLDCTSYDQLCSEVHKAEQKQQRANGPVPGADAPISDADVPEEPAVSAEEDVQEVFVEPEPAEEPEQPEEPVEVLDYEDPDGWDALGLSVQDAMEQAIHLGGEDRLAALLAYLHAAELLNPAFGPVCRCVSLAADDPLQDNDYSPEAVMEQYALAGSETDGELLDGCLAAAALRSALHSVSYGYLMNSLLAGVKLAEQIPALREMLDTMDRFRIETGEPLDRYAVSLDHGNDDPMEDLVRRAEAAYERYMNSPVRESVKQARLIETKRVLFAKEGMLSRLLENVIARDDAALEQEKQAFFDRFVRVHDSGMQVKQPSVEELIVEAWEQAGKKMLIEQISSDLQGNLRNNLRSSLIEILEILIDYYDILSSGASVESCRTEKGKHMYEQMQPELLSKAKALMLTCDALPTAELTARGTGLFLLKHTVQEIYARLSGTWDPRRKQEFYIGFLRGEEVQLNEDLLPDLRGTFCGLPGFDILSRIRRHADQQHRDIHSQLARIYGPDQTAANYGTGNQICALSQDVELPEKAEQLRAFSLNRMEEHYLRFRRGCKLDRLRGRLSSLDFVHLEQTAAYWHTDAARTRNYGFFHRLLDHLELAVTEKSRPCQAVLNGQLAQLEAENPGWFAQHPEQADAIRAQIEAQNFTAAEDWMGQISTQELNLSVEVPARMELDRFVRESGQLSSQLSDVQCPVQELLNCSGEAAKALTESWCGDGWSEAQVPVLLEQLGWQKVHAAAVEGQNRYAVESDPDLLGSQLYVACLSGVYNLQNLLAHLKQLDREAVHGSRIVLLDNALNLAERRVLAAQMHSAGLTHSCLVIDRVLLGYLAQHAEEGGLHRRLLDVGLPFSFCKLDTEEAEGLLTPAQADARLTGLLRTQGLFFRDKSLETLVLNACGYESHSLDRAAANLVKAQRSLGLEVPCDVTEDLLQLALSGSSRSLDAWEQAASLGQEAGHSMMLLLGWLNGMSDQNGWTVQELAACAADLRVPALHGMDEAQMAELLQAMQRGRLVRSVYGGRWCVATRYLLSLLGTEQQIETALIEEV